MKNWYIYQKAADFGEISKKFNISPITARIIRNRDIIGNEAIEEYLIGNEKNLHDPFLFKGMENAVIIIRDTIENHEKIRIMGDYDIDGTCASYILKKFINSIGGSADAVIPNRMTDGYGINIRMVEEAFNDNVRLIITCDNGISAVEAVKRARELGLKVIVTDHHQIPAEIPEADVILNPHMKDSGYPFEDLCGAGVAYKLCQALDKDNPLLDELILFAGFATVGDIVPLVGENRIFAKEAIKRLNECQNIGMRALISVNELSESQLDSYHIGFVLGPCINAAGRLETADLVLDLFETDDYDKALITAEKLRLLNDKRKTVTEEDYKKAENEILAKCDNGEELDKILAVYIKEGHESIAGIVAGRLKEKFKRPVFVVVNGESGLKGSGRSTENYNMIEEISKVPELFEKFGGHKMACGFSLKDDSVEPLRKAVNSLCELSEDKLADKIWIDILLPFEYVSESLINELELIKPFGASNPKPLFAERNIKVDSMQILGANKNVLKFKFENEKGFLIDGIMFGNPETIKNRFDELSEEKEKNADFLINILYYPQINEFRGFKTLQVAVSEFSIQK